MVTVSLGREEIESFAKRDIGFYGLDLKRISSVLIVQIMQIQSSRSLDTHEIMHQVKYLENLIDHSGTKKHEKFKGSVLKGLYKKHFMNAAYLIKNINAHYGINFEGNSRLDKRIQDVIDENTTGYTDGDFAGKLADELVFKGIQERATQGFTGEWIVFQKYQGKNYYLTLAQHDEGDENIYNRVVDVYEYDFPFLKISN